MKLIIDIPEEMYERTKDGYVPLGISKYLKNGTPLDDVKAEIHKAYEDVTMYSCDEQVSCFASRVCKILDNVGKAESEE